MWPLWVRKFIVDFVETSIAVLLTLNVAFPSNLNEASALGVAVLVGVFGAGVSAFRRAVPELLKWLRNKMNVPVTDE